MDRAAGSQGFPSHSPARSAILRALRSIAFGAVVAIVPALLSLGLVGLAFVFFATVLEMGRVPVKWILIPSWAVFALAAAALHFRAGVIEALDTAGPREVRFRAPLGRARSEGDDPAARKVRDLCDCMARSLSASDLRCGPVVDEDYGAGFRISDGAASVFAALSVVTGSLGDPSSEFSLWVEIDAPPLWAGGEDVARRFALRASVEDALFGLLAGMGFDPSVTRPSRPRR